MRPKDLPDILFISVDAMRRDCMAPYGMDLMPEATRLLSGGVAFDRCVAAAPWTGASFGSMFTGLWPRQHGFQVNLHHRGSPMQISPLKPDARLLSEMLKSAGYHTICSQGNAGCCGPEFGMSRGFDEYHLWEKLDWRPQGWDREKQALKHALAYGGLARYARLTLYRFGKRFEKRDLPDRSPMETAPGIVDAAAAMLRRSPGEKPVFLWVNFMDMHEPFFLSRRWERLLSRPHPETRRVHLSPKFCFDERLDEQDKAYMKDRYRLIARTVDRGIRRLLATWGACRRKRSRLTIFVSDHGEEFWDHGTDIASDCEYRRGIGHGHTLFGELVNIPWVIHWPEGGIRGARIGRLVSGVDVVPTVVDLLGLDENTSRLAGVSQARSVSSGEGGEEGGRVVFSDSIYYGPLRQAAISGTHKLVRCAETGEEQLFAWGLNDSREVNDLARSGEHSGIRRDLSAALDGWNAQLTGASPQSLGEEEQKAVAERLKAWGYL